MNYSS